MQHPSRGVASPGMTANTQQLAPAVPLPLFGSNARAPVHANLSNWRSAPAPAPSTLAASGSVPGDGGGCRSLTTSHTIPEEASLLNSTLRVEVEAGQAATASALDGAQSPSPGTLIKSHAAGAALYQSPSRRADMTNLLCLL